MNSCTVSNKYPCFAGRAIPFFRTLTAVSTAVAASPALAGVVGSAEGAAAGLTVREWWAVGMGAGGMLLVLWLGAVVCVVLGKLKGVLRGSSGGVTNITPGGLRKICELNPYFSICLPENPCNCDRLGLPKVALPAKQAPNER